MQAEYQMKNGNTTWMPGNAEEIRTIANGMEWKIVRLQVFVPSIHMRGGIEPPKCSECGKNVDVSSVPENVDSYLCEVCEPHVTAAPGAGIVPRSEEEVEAVHTCAVCGNTMSSEKYEVNGCIFCGADSDE